MNFLLTIVVCQRCLVSLSHTHEHTVVGSGYKPILGFVQTEGFHAAPIVQMKQLSRPIQETLYRNERRNENSQECSKRTGLLHPQTGAAGRRGEVCEETRYVCSPSNYLPYGMRLATYSDAECCKILLSIDVPIRALPHLTQYTPECRHFIQSLLSVSLLANYSLNII